jgi:ABC-type nickel/cobalt efflux system permease component RcnA
VAWTGFAAGAAHVVTGVDHLAALLPISIGRRFRAFFLGARWGLGHSAGVLLVGSLGLAFRSSLDLELVGSVAERLVGVMLIALGGVGIRRALGLRLHSHVHEHDGTRHAHLHAHVASDPAPGRHAGNEELHRHRHTAFFAGTLHGVAGTAHVLGVLPALALPGWSASAGYLAAFAVGTVLAMGVFALLLGASSSAASDASLRRTLIGASSLTVLVGLGWLALPFLGLELPG